MELLSTLRHPNIVCFLGASIQSQSLAWLVMEYVERGSVWDVIHVSDGAKEISLQTRLRMFVDAALGVNHLHYQIPPIVHGDIKSPNLLVTKHYNVKVGDLGTSQRLRGGMKLEHVSPRWAAPEVMNGAGLLTEKVDIYSLGVILWELVTGEIPWEHLDVVAIPHVVVTQNMRPPLEGLRKVMPEIAEIIARCWSSQPSDRPPINEVIDSVRALLAVMEHDAASRLTSPTDISLEILPLERRREEAKSPRQLVIQPKVEAPTRTTAVPERPAEEIVTRPSSIKMSKVEEELVISMLKLEPSSVEVLEEIGRGTASTVYKGRFRSMDVAVKCFKQASNKVLEELALQVKTAIYILIFNVCLKLFLFITILRPIVPDVTPKYQFISWILYFQWRDATSP
jgi:serine/threonine protein kinase